MLDPYIVSAGPEPAASSEQYIIGSQCIQYTISPIYRGTLTWIAYITKEYDVSPQHCRQWLHVLYTASLYRYPAAVYTFLCTTSKQLYTPQHRNTTAISNIDPSDAHNKTALMATGAPLSILRAAQAPHCTALEACVLYVVSHMAFRILLNRDRASIS